MKRTMPKIFLSLSLLCLLAVVAWVVSCVADYQAISNDPSVSGIDYLGLGFLYAIGFMLCSVPGIVFSALLRHRARSNALICVSWILSVIFAICLLAAFALWFFGPGHF